ncbi:hypothetical protein ES332_D13G090300v1 [Gossypium tomentosum]|uniref:Uncharacterized protein n=1 Tax=Gossypium tomentosum TaxID=34277 RepID=A0A5D2HUV6_GOSTO|nr:hypothetical protein ES332_D13G090300v1 [Gossypium tomentosum]
MAMQTGVGLSKILILAGAGTVPTEFRTSTLLFYFSYCFNFDFNLLISFSSYTGTVLLKKGKLSDILGELQAFCGACSLVSVLFNSLSLAFKFAEMEYVAKVGNLLEASKRFATLENIVVAYLQQLMLKYVHRITHGWFDKELNKCLLWAAKWSTSEESVNVLLEAASQGHRIFFFYFPHLGMIMVAVK